MICENPPDFAKRGGLGTAIAQDHETGEILMVAYMNEESFRRTLELGQVVYWSTSRNELWHKGESSGNVSSRSATRATRPWYNGCSRNCGLFSAHRGV